MIRDITIGQYYPANSRVHRLDPRTKIVCTLLYLISLFLFKNMLGYVIATIFLFAVVRISKVPVKFIVKGLKPIIFFFFLFFFFLFCFFFLVVVFCFLLFFFFLRMRDFERQFLWQFV